MLHLDTGAGLEIGRKLQTLLLSGGNVWGKSSCNFATVREVLVTRAPVLVTLATIFVEVLSSEVGRQDGNYSWSDTQGSSQF